MDKLTNQTDRDKVDEFVSEYLACDGVFILRLVGHNTDAVTVTEFVCALWDKWRYKPVEDLDDGKDHGASGRV